MQTKNVRVEVKTHHKYKTEALRKGITMEMLINKVLTDAISTPTPQTIGVKK